MIGSAGRSIDKDSQVSRSTTKSPQQFPVRQRPPTEAETQIQDDLLLDGTCTDEKTQRQYYANIETGESLWSPPQQARYAPQRGGTAATPPATKSKSLKTLAPFPGLIVDRV